MSDRRRTATSNFGVSRRESHDSSAFYDRFRPPEISDDHQILVPQPVAEPFQQGDARNMNAVADGSVALVVTSPPYFAGKQYEEELERDGVPSSYLEYLTLLTEVFAECVRTLEPGGRIAVNVANLGRKPYRSLSADIIRILEIDLGLLLRGEIVWQKAEGASGSCAWGSYRSASNPVIRDLTERVIVASKGRFDRAQSIKERRASGLPHESTIATDDFLSLTLDTWSIPPESARRIGHPAPFPVELPAKLIRLYTFKDDLILDPFMGSGSTLVAASQLQRRFVGYDLDPDYVAIARRRVEQEGQPLDLADEGLSATALAKDLIEEAGFEIVATNKRIPATGVSVDFVLLDAAKRSWYVDVAGASTQDRGGLTRLDETLRALGRAAAIRGRIEPDARIALMTSQIPDLKSESGMALRSAGPALLDDVFDLHSEGDRVRLAAMAHASEAPTGGFFDQR